MVKAQAQNLLVGDIVTLFDVEYVITDIDTNDFNKMIVRFMSRGDFLNDAEDLITLICPKTFPFDIA